MRFFSLLIVTMLSHSLLIAKLDHNGIPIPETEIWHTMCNLFTNRATKLYEAFNAGDLEEFKKYFRDADCLRNKELITKAIVENKIDFINFLKERGINVKQLYQQYSVSAKPLFDALIQKHGDNAFAMITLLQELGFNWQKDDNGNYLIHIQALNRNAEQVKKLLAAKCPINPNNEGFTPFHIAAAQNDVATTEILLDDLHAKENINIKNKDGHTPLMMSVMLMNDNVANKLIMDAHLESEDNEGNTVEKIALKNLKWCQPDNELSIEKIRYRQSQCRLAKRCFNVIKEAKIAQKKARIQELIERNKIVVENEQKLVNEKKEAIKEAYEEMQKEVMQEENNFQEKSQELYKEINALEEVIALEENGSN